MRIKGQQGIADLFGVSRETIDTWQQQGFPVSVRGGPGVASEYDSEACITWLAVREVARAQQLLPQDRLAIAKAEKLEFEIADLRERLIPGELLDARMARIRIGIRNACREMRAELAPSAVGKSADDIELLFAQAFDQLLVRASNWRQMSGKDVAE